MTPYCTDSHVSVTLKWQKLAQSNVWIPVPRFREGEEKEAEDCFEVPVSSVQHTYTEAHNMPGPGNEYTDKYNVVPALGACSVELFCPLEQPLAPYRY